MNYFAIKIILIQKKDITLQWQIYQKITNYKQIFIKMKKYLACMMAALTLVSCTGKKAEEAPATKTLILYYSQTGTTQSVATELQKQLGADAEAIEVEEAYDGDFGATIARCQQEMAEGKTPTLKPIKANLDQYDTIFLGYPIWFGTYAMPIASLVKEVSFEGKKVVPFCTFGSGGLQASVAALQAALPKAEVVEGYGVRTVRVASAPAEINRFLIERDYKEGEIAALPAFLEHKPCTEEEVKIFNEACSSYQYPLGTPVDVAVRECETSVDYEFTASSPAQDGTTTESTIYVTIAKEEGAKPEFTMVVR